MGLVKAFYGLAGSLLTAVYYAFFAADGQVPAFLLFLGIAQPALALVVTPLLRQGGQGAPAVHTSSARRFGFGYAVVLLLALLVLAA